MSHFWESPSFSWNLPDSQEFRTDVLNPLDIGYQPRQRFLNMYTLRDLRNNNNLGGAGPNTLGHIFDDQNQPQIWIFTPKKLNPDNSDPGLTGVPSTPMYEEHIDKVEDVLYNIFPSTPGSTSVRVHVKEYRPMVNIPDNADHDYNFARGKILIQYQPAPRACAGGQEPKAKYRVWVDGLDDDHINDEWEAGQEQHVPAPAGPGQLDSCPQTSSSVSSASATSSTPLSASSMATTVQATSPTAQGTATSKSRSVSIVTVPSVIVTLTVPSVTVTAPPTPTCDDQCKLNKGNRCNCDENGCDADSPACCANSSCPKCDCKLDDSDHGYTCNFDCCATNTCQWSSASPADE